MRRVGVCDHRHEDEHALTERHDHTVAWTYATTLTLCADFVPVEYP